VTDFEVLDSPDRVGKSALAELVICEEIDDAPETTSNTDYDDDGDDCSDAREQPPLVSEPPSPYALVSSAQLSIVRGAELVIPPAADAAAGDAPARAPGAAPSSTSEPTAPCAAALAPASLLPCPPGTPASLAREAETAAAQAFLLQAVHKAAWDGSADLQLSLGRLYRLGLGVDRDPARAAEWFRRAADKGHCGGYLWLGRCYRDGEGLARDLKLAECWLRKAAGWGLTEAQVELGRLYLSGEGVPKNLHEAFAWLSKAADSGHPEARRIVDKIREYVDGL